MACRAPVFQKVTRIMRRGSTKRIGLRFLTVAIFFELCASVTSAAAFRLSFLEEPPILEDTCQLLLLYPDYGYEHWVGKPRSEAETRLGLSLRAARSLAYGDLERDEGIE